MSLNFTKFKESKQSDFFNQSFYQQKLGQDLENIKQNSYTSYEYIKKYFKVTRISELINKIVKEILESNYLPENPYNMIGRLLLHEAIFENIKVHYIINTNQMNQKGLLTNQYQDLSIEAQTKISASDYVMVQMKIEGISNSNQSKDVSRQSIYGSGLFIVGWKIRPLLRHDVIKVLWSQLIQKRKNYSYTMDKKETKKRKIIKVENSLGGSLILRIGCPFSADSIATVFEYIYTGFFETQEHFTGFANYIIDDCIKFCEGSNNIFIKLKIHSLDQTTTEWSAQNLIHNRLKIVKEIQKSLYLKKVDIRMQCVCKVDAVNIKVLGTSYIRYKKVYVLVQERDAKDFVIFSVSPVFNLLCSIHESNSLYYESLTKSISPSPQQMVHALQQETHQQIIFELLNQRVPELCWSLFYNDLYENADNQRNSKQLKSSIIYMIETPIAFIQQLKYHFNIAKLLCSRSSVSSHENQIYEILEYCDQILKFQIRKQEHIYPESTVFIEAAQKNIDAILQNRRNKKMQLSIRSQIQKLESIFKYLLNSFYQITFVLKGHLLNEIIRIDNIFGKEGSGEMIKKTLTYDIFLRKYKNLARRNLNMVTQVKLLKQAINRPESDIKQLILAKYAKNYSLYEIIYEYYWGIICGKKLNYPLTKLVNLMREQAIRFDSKLKRREHEHANIQQNKLDGIMIYQKSADARSQHLFYSFSVEALEDTKVKDYRVVKQIFQDLFQVNPISDRNIQASEARNPSPMAYHNRNSYIVSIDSNIRHGHWQQANFNHCYLYIDSIFHIPIPSTQIYQIIAQEIKQKILDLDKKGFGVVGVYSGQPQLINEDQVFPWTEQEQKYDVNFARYQSKKQFSFEVLAKIISNSQKTGNKLILKCVFWLNGILKFCTMAFNFLINKVWLTNAADSYHSRVFQRNQDIVRWGNYNGLKKYLQTQRQIKSSQSYNRRASTKQLYLQNHIDMIQFMANENQNQIDIAKVRTYSPFYAKLEQAHHLAQGLFYMLEYMKSDRQNKFGIQKYDETLDILEYYLFEQCLKQDRYIYSEGLSVMTVNLMDRIQDYIDSHSDNNGTEKQLINLQKIVLKLMNCINHGLISCGFGVLQAIQSQSINDDDDDDD